LVRPGIRRKWKKRGTIWGKRQVKAIPSGSRGLGGWSALPAAAAGLLLLATVSTQQRLQGNQGIQIQTEENKGWAIETCK